MKKELLQLKAQGVTLASLMLNEAKLMCELIKKVSNDYGGIALRKTCMAMAGILLNRLYLENVTDKGKFN